MLYYRKVEPHTHIQRYMCTYPSPASTIHGQQLSTHGLILFHPPTLRSNNSTLRYLPKRNENKLHKDVYMNLYSSFIYKSQEEYLEIPINYWITEQTVCTLTMQHYSAIKRINCWYMRNQGVLSNHYAKWKKPNTKWHTL